MNEKDSLIMELEEKYNQLINSIDKNKKRYFHLRTVKNFILHFFEIKNDNVKSWIFKNLNEYLLESKSCLESIDGIRSRELYVKYLDKVADYYRENLQFTLYISFLTSTLIAIAVLLVVKVIFFSWLYSIVFTAFCYLAFYIYLFYKQNIHKTFGLFH
jgi:hypothetical protein